MSQPGGSYDPINEKKAVLREKLKELRAQVNPGMAEAASQSIWSILRGLKEYKKASGIGAFASTPNEINTLQVLEGTLKAGKKLFLPRVTAAKTHFEYFPIQDLKNLKPGAYGILEPAEGQPAPWGMLDLVLVPGLVFDRLGNRLGFGKGYYDHVLPQIKESALVVGLAYSFQIIDQVPYTSEDFPMDALLTEKEFTYCKGK
ncbi:MAG TPA: 5-formyltetrahydrofolate cyclo-ligase [bacterium]|nr:5-formyltetrahydrofolate cyclo-ligase [bacterium]